MESNYTYKNHPKRGERVTILSDNSGYMHQYHKDVIGRSGTIVKSDGRTYFVDIPDKGVQQFHFKSLFNINKY